MTQLYFICPDTETRHGGVKKLYRQVDILNAHGFSAAVLHTQPGFRCRWFENQTRVTYESELQLTDADILVIPEVYGPDIAELHRGTKKVIFNQNAYYTFLNYSLNLHDFRTPYLDEDVIAAIAVSNDNQQYLRYAFPDLTVHRIYYGFNPSLFQFNAAKKRQIAFLTSKGSEDLTQVINILKFRDSLKDFQLVPIENKSEADVAQILQESLILLWFTYQEGFGMFPAEALACGCIVIGFDGLNDGEYLKPEFSYPIKRGDVISLAQTVESVIHLYHTNPQALAEKSRLASEFIHHHYSYEVEEKSVIQAWTQILDTPFRSEPISSARTRYLDFLIQQRQAQLEQLEIQFLQRQLELDQFQAQLDQLQS